MAVWIPVIDTLLRNDLILINEVGFAPLDDTGAQLLLHHASLVVTDGDSYRMHQAGVRKGAP
jgi:hypothetical protein